MVNSISGTDAAASYYKALQDKAIDFLKPVVKSRLYPVQYPAQGDLMWYYQSLQSSRDMNQGTWDYLSARVYPGDIAGTVQLGAASSFPNAYSQVVTAITYTLSSANQAKLNEANQKAVTQSAAIVTQYQQLYGEITPALLSLAKVSTPIDYIISYVLGSQWSGQSPPLKWSEMQAARNLVDLLPDMPMSGQALLAPITNYLNIMQPVLTLSNVLQQGQWILRELVRNTSEPAEANGGIKLVNPITGATSPYNVAIQVPSSLSDLSNSLQGSSELSVNLKATAGAGSTLMVSVEGQAGISIGSLLQFDVGASASYDMTKIQGTSRDLTVAITYPGVTKFPVEPKAWDQATGIGWYYADPIAQAVQNADKDVDGFKFASPPAFNMHDISVGGTFGLLQTLVISRFPTIKLTYHQASFQSFQQSWSEKLSGNIKLFGFLKLGSFSEGAWGSSYEAGTDDSTFSVTFTPSPQVLSVPQLQQLAFVIAGAVTNPGTLV